MVKNRKLYKQTYYQKYPEKRAAYQRNSRIRRRAKILLRLGNRCANPECRWIGADGSIGCTDTRCLQIDHVNGGGNLEVAALGQNAYLRKVLSDTTGSYQLLCANCNWIKRAVRREFIHPKEVWLSNA